MSINWNKDIYLSFGIAKLWEVVAIHVVFVLACIGLAILVWRDNHG